jgi:hypothetical protein
VHSLQEGLRATAASAAKPWAILKKSRAVCLDTQQITNVIIIIIIIISTSAILPFETSAKEGARAHKSAALAAVGVFQECAAARKLLHLLHLLHLKLKTPPLPRCWQPGEHNRLPAAGFKRGPGGHFENVCAERLRPALQSIFAKPVISK